MSHFTCANLREEGSKRQSWDGGCALSMLRGQAGTPARPRAPARAPWFTYVVCISMVVRTLLYLPL